MSKSGPDISVKKLSYSHTPPSPPSLRNISIYLPPGSRTIICGANGAGKSTLLQILAGKRLVTAQGADVRIKGKDVFRDSPPGVTFLGTEWAMNPVIRSDIEVSHFLDSVGAVSGFDQERCDHLLDILDVDLSWRMHQISDGERRRVQLCMGLMAKWDILLLDEVTVDLDVLVRDELLAFLKKDSIKRETTILYATHIFDGLDTFPTHIAHMRFGEFVTEPIPWPFTPPSDLVETPVTMPIYATPSSLYTVALRWLTEDREYRRGLEKQGRKTRGARRDNTVPTDAETFFKKYDYAH